MKDNSKLLNHQHDVIWFRNDDENTLYINE